MHEALTPGKEFGAVEGKGLGENEAVTGREGERGFERLQIRGWGEGDGRNRNELAATANRGEEGAGIRGGKVEGGVMGRLFKGFEEGVTGFGG